MQRVARQAVYAERRALQRREQIEKSNKRRFDKEQKVHRQRWRTAMGRLKRDAIAALKTDVELGELAPRRDIGLEAERFGVLPDDFRMGPIAHPNVFQRLYDKRQTTTELFRSYKVDDKVIIVNGIGQGKVGFVKDVVWDAQKVRLSGMLEVCRPELERLN
jgi:large subunit ribosomal protein L24